MKNVLPVKSAVRRPRALIKINDVTIPGWTSLTLDSNSYYQADTFTADFAVSQLPKANGLSWFSDQDELNVEIFTGFPTDPDNYTTADLDSVFAGVVDDIDASMTGFSLGISGRDLSSRLIDTKTIEKYPNLTASQIATKIAQSHGLTPVVTTTTVKVGKYYEIDNVRLQDDRTEWDLLCYLAREEGFLVFTRGKELHFEPLPTISDAPYVFEWVPGVDGGPPSGNFTSLGLMRALTLAKDIVVQVRSWNPRQKQSFVKQAKATRKGGGSKAGVQTYTYTVANLTPAQAQERANTLLAQLTQHERKAVITGPADNLLTSQTVVQIKGTGTSWDQTYFVDTLHRSFDDNDSYSWNIKVKNHSPESVTTP